MNRRVLTFVAATATAMASLPAAASSGAPLSSRASAIEPRKPTVRLTVDTSRMGDEAETTRDWVLRDGAVKLAASGLNVSEDAAELDVRVFVKPEQLGYTVAVEIWEDGAKAPILKRGPQVCEACTRTEVVELIGHELAWSGGWLSRRGPAEGSTGSAVQEPGSAVDEPNDAAQAPGSADPANEHESSDRPGRKLHALGWAGVGVGAVGLGVITGGLVVAVRPYEAKGEPGDYRVPRLEHPQRLGWALVGIGAAAAVGGAVMLAFDLKRNRTRRLGVGPWLDRQAAGLWVRRSF